MNLLHDLLRMLTFSKNAVRAQAERQSLFYGILCFGVGFFAFTTIRSAVYASLPDLLGPFELTGPVLHLTRTVVFVLLIYIPAVIVLSNAIAGDGLGLAISRQEYRGHASAILPLWGILFLIDAPLQYFAPQFLIVGVVGISVGMLVLLPLMVVYTVWGIKELNYLSPARAIAIFILSLLTLPLYYLVNSFLFALPFFILFPLIYWGCLRMRDYASSQANERAFRQNLHTLTLNPQDADAHYQLGLIHLKRGNLEVARRYFESAMKIDSTDADYHYFMGRAYEYQGDWAKALAQYEETYSLNPEYGLGDIFREVGKAYLNTGSVEKGIEFLNFFLTKRDSDPEGRYWLAVAFQRSEKLDQMRMQLRLMLEHAHSSPRFFRKENREWIYKARGLLRDAGPCQDASAP
jgi:hypothetical protein